jgi:hypothetical protein
MRGGRLRFCNYCTEDDQKLDPGRGRPARFHSTEYVTNLSISAVQFLRVSRTYVSSFVRLYLRNHHQSQSSQALFLTSDGFDLSYQENPNSLRCS